MPKPSDPSQPLRALMQSRGFQSFRQLSQASGISMKQLRKIRKGDLDSLRLGALSSLAQTLNLSLSDLLTTLLPTPPLPTPHSPTSPLPTPFLPEFSTDPQAYTALKSEYHRLQQQQDQQIQTAILESQAQALQILESWLQFWPVAAQAVQTNPEFSASKLLPLCRPIETLLENWDVVAIAKVGEELPYDPQLHQLLEANIPVGEPVRVRYPGYIHRGKLLFRAKVSPIVAQPTENPG